MRKVLISMILVLLLSSCSHLYTAVPYVISGEMKLNDKGEGDLSSFDFTFKNCGNKEIFSFTVSFFLFDEDDTPVLNGNPKVTCIIREDIPSGDILESSFSLDSFLNYIPETPYKIEYLYVKKIIYSDGTEWEDVLGLKAMKEGL